MFSLLMYTVRHHARTARGSENSGHDKKNNFKYNKFFDTEWGHIIGGRLVGGPCVPRG
jgi:hypothetical protein